MIRDPSDGSGREKPMAEIPAKPMVSASPIPSGLPLGSTKPENIARLEKSREWLKQYRNRSTGEENENDSKA